MFIIWTMSHLDVTVTVSVWNDFWGNHLCEGLMRAGCHPVYHHTGGQTVSGVKDIRNWPAAIFNRAGFKGYLSKELAFRISRLLVDRYATALVQQSDVFWGWSGCSRNAMMAARKKGIPTLLERGSTHCIWQRDKVAREYQRLGVEQAFYYPDFVTTNDTKEYDLADRICVPSRYVANSFLEHGVDPNKLIVNAYGVDYDFWSDVQRSNQKADMVTFLWVAGLNIRKGFPVLLEAWKKADLKNAELVCIGSVDPAIEELLYALPASVSMLGYQSHNQIRDFMAKSTVYLLPSFEEGMARSVLEASATGLPSIITEETGVTDVLKSGDECWVVPAGEVDALVDTLREIAQSPDQSVVRGVQAQRAVKPYSWTSYGDRAAAHLTQLLESI